VRPEGSVFKRVEMEAGLVHVMCKAVVDSATLNQGMEAPNFDLINALQIHDLVFHPLSDFLKPGSDLLVLADGPLWTVPLSCLVAKPMQQPTEEALPSTDPAPVRSDQREDNMGDEREDASVVEQYQRLFGFREWLDTRTAREAVSAISESGGWLADRYSISL